MDHEGRPSTMTTTTRPRESIPPGDSPHDTVGRHPSRRMLLLGASALGVSAAALSTGVSPANAAATSYLSVPYGSTLMRSTTSTVSPASWDQWRADGFPAPRPAAMQYVKYPWDSTIYARATAPDSTAGESWKPLEADEWKRAGYPRPRADLLVPGTKIYKWNFWSTIFCELGGVHHAMSMGEWRALGAPTPQITDSGFGKLSWDSSIGQLTSLSNGIGYPISNVEWARRGYPPPFEAVRFPGDQFEMYGSDSTIYYFGPTYAGPISYGQWRAAGFPRPVRKG